MGVVEGHQGDPVFSFLFSAVLRFDYILTTFQKRSSGTQMRLESWLIFQPISFSFKNRANKMTFPFFLYFCTTIHLHYIKMHKQII